MSAFCYVVMDFKANIAEFFNFGMDNDVNEGSQCWFVMLKHV